MRLNHIEMSKLQIIIHIAGLACLGGSIGLQILIFTRILQQGYFRAVESNPAILYPELALTGFAAAYFIYVCRREIRLYSNK